VVEEDGICQKTHLSNQEELKHKNVSIADRKTCTGKKEKNKNIALIFRSKIGNNKTSQELKLTGNRNNRKGCYKCASHKKKFRVNVNVLLKSWYKLLMGNTGKI